jgi:DHA2 family multidrug resistance protein
VPPARRPAVPARWLAARFLPGAAPRLREARALDLFSLTLMALGLAALVIALKQGPERGWTSGLVLGLLGLSVASAVAFVRRTLRSTIPIVDLQTFADRRFAVGCILSFVLGIGLFGSVYLMPVFLAFVRGHDALHIGAIMLVTGIAQLLMAPVAVALEQRANARLLTAAGFGLFAFGLGMSAFQTPETDFAGMFWPQVVRGLAIMFCLLPPTRLALGHLDEARLGDASGVFNLMRNLGGAIGLALIDTVIYTRAPHLGARIVERLESGDTATAEFIGVSRSTCSRTARPGRSTPPPSSS